MAYTSLSFSPWSSSQAYSQFDIAGGISVFDYTQYYSTLPGIATNLNNSPSTTYSYNITGYSRSQDVVTLLFSHTTGPAFGPGSIISANPGADSTAAYAGMVLNGGSGIVTYLSAGYDKVPQTSNGTISSTINQAWTTGFMFIPSYSTQLEVQQNTINAQFEPGYEQRQASSINPNVDVWSLAFMDRSSKEARAIRHFTQTMAGVYSFPIMMTDPNFNNQPNAKFVTAAGAKIQSKSYNLNDISIQVRRVFDF
jgi:phage-related protein